MDAKLTRTNESPDVHFVQRSSRYVPLGVWIIAILTVVCVAGKIIGYGYLPVDDALRHAAKAYCGKPWSEILVMRPDFAMDPHPGWHAILGFIHRCLDCSVETLVVIPVMGLMMLVSVAGLTWLRRPECWLAALLTAAVCTPAFIVRLTLGRPYIVTMIIFMLLLLIWSRLGERRPGPGAIIATILLIAAAAWIHGSFYQLIIPAAGLLLAGRLRQAIYYGVLWAAGSVLGATFTGHPWIFLDQCVRHLSGVFGSSDFARLLVPELRPFDGQPLIVGAVIAMLFWRARSPDWKHGDLVDPVFMMGVLGWLLGLKVGRFWWDWGEPAILIWLALELQKQFENYMPLASWNRLVVTAALAIGVFLGVGSDRDDRWTGNLNRQFLSPETPGMVGWLPDSDGIVYSVDMTVFNDLFYKNPTAPWRYILGFESALMLPEDLDVVHKVTWNFGDLRAYDPWIRKMRPQDRLIIPGSWLPTIGVTRGANIPELEWHQAPNDWWIGRLPRKPASPVP
jgi:hypothetical protein